uniref:Uncharacterized protein n=1 Tax=Anguilla anguilla TaxID=7936 RepID=A0A0E9R129_ANGAN
MGKQVTSKSADLKMERSYNELTCH